MKKYVGLPFDKIVIDVLTVMDYFSIKEVTTVASTMVDNVCTRFGVTLELHSVQGRNFLFVRFVK